MAVTPSPEIKKIHTNLIVPKALREQAYILAETIADVDRRGNAFGFLRQRNRTRKEIESFIERMTNGKA